MEVLRIGHRPGRDKRVTTHVCLVARALGADGVVLSAPDPHIERGVSSVVRRFGGSFYVRPCSDWRGHIRAFRGTRVHLTMYGEPLEPLVSSLPKGEPVLVIVGAAKVPPSVYELADFNAAVTNQPHSEVAALALFLDRWFGGRELGRDFGGPVAIVPSRRGKRVRDARALEEE
ncbi:MAG: tRNA (cytidine(56)-2'-O)-methyltransferase [Thermoplasmatota archaeon]